MVWYSSILILIDVVSGPAVPMDLDVKMKAVMILAAVIIVSCFWYTVEWSATQ